MMNPSQNNSIVAVRGIFRRLSFLAMLGAVSLGVLAALVLYVVNAPPEDFPLDHDVVIEEGLSISAIGTLLEEAHLIKSARLFYFFIRSSYSDTVIQAGSYRFEKPLTTRALIETLRDGSSRSPLISLTFPEGFSVYDIREYTRDVFDSIDMATLVPNEGFLFPDTYFVSKTETLSDLILRMKGEYEAKIDPYRAQIEASGFTEQEVIILASILEREANDKESMRMVSGILQNRLREDLPLQVDAAFEYILGKTSEELTREDLQMDSPYNTYTNKGLPPTPISNPGITAIEAVLNPTPSEYYYYLTDSDGVFHYAKSFDEHKQNKERFLK